MLSIKDTYISRYDFMYRIANVCVHTCIDKLCMFCTNSLRMIILQIKKYVLFLVGVVIVCCTSSILMGYISVWVLHELVQYILQYYTTAIIFAILHKGNSYANATLNNLSESD